MLPIQNGGVAPSITGVVKQYLLTPVGDVEGLELQDGTDVRFPPSHGCCASRDREAGRSDKRRGICRTSDFVRSSNQGR